MLETDTFRIHCFQTLTGKENERPTKLKNAFSASFYFVRTPPHPNLMFLLSFFSPLNPGTKFLLVADPQQPSIDHTMKKIYECYSDYCVKNPFQNPEMPIRSEQFDVHLLKLVKSVGGLVVSHTLPQPYNTTTTATTATINNNNQYSVPYNTGIDPSVQGSSNLPPTLPNIASSGLGLGV